MPRVTKGVMMATNAAVFGIGLVGFLIGCLLVYRAVQTARN
jgi:hypothetical protein